MAIASNYVIQTGAIAWFAAQFLKLVFDFLTTKKFNIWRFIGGSGGMPSSHSSLVCAVCVAIYKTMGADSPVFGLAVFFALVVMYDASGVRRAAGEQAKVINDLVEQIGGDDFVMDKELKELLGHTKIEVVCGALLGVLIGLLY